MSGAECVEPHLRCLRAVGFCCVQRGAGGRRETLHELYRAAVLAVTSTYWLQECIYAYQMRSDMEELSRGMFLVLCHMTSLVKQTVFVRSAGRVEALVSALQVAGDAGGARGGEDTVAAALSERTRRRAARLQAWFAGAAALTCVLWLVFPLAARLQQRHATFSFWLPENPHAPLWFAAALFYQFYATTLIGIANTTMDAFIATVLYHCQTQLRILRLRFENLQERAEHIQRQSDESLEEVTWRLFKECVNHYHKIIETSNKLQDVFGLSILINFAVGGWTLCMAVYKLVSVSMLSVEFMSVLLFISCILFELYLYCYYGNEVTVESELLVQSVFACGWNVRGGRGGRGGRGLRQRLSRGVLLALIRACRPLRPSALQLVPLSLDTFLKILKSSYSFYAVLRQTKDKL